MKKVVNSVLASALALTVAPVVVGAEEATTPSVDPTIDKTVKRLNALELVQGRGNGDFAVEAPITRAEFATLVVRARGLASGVPLAQYQSRFADVKSTDWFSGWVNVAAGQELVKGYENKTFRPNNNVTYAEAVAMIIRALGYDVPGSVKGAWPNNYIAKAAELGISKGVKVDPNKPATRGDIFLMLDNSLNIGLMKQIEYGTDIRYEIYDGKNGLPKQTLLNQYLNVDVYDMDWANDDNHTSDDLPFVSNVPVIGLGTLKPNEVNFDGKGSPLKGKYKVADGINPNDFGGQHVQVWVKDGREDVIVWMEGSEDEEVVNAKLDTFYYKGNTVKPALDLGELDSDEIKNFEVKLDNGKKYKFADDFKITFNFKRFDDNWQDAFEAIVINDVDIDSFSVKAVLDDEGKISYLSVVDDRSADLNTSYKFGSEVIEKVDTDKQKIYTLKGDDVDLKGKEEGTDFLVIRNGQPAKFADLKPMDVYSIYYADGNKDKKVIVANSDVVEGKVDSVQYKNDKDFYIKIGDKTYRLRKATYSEDNNKTIEDTPVDKIKNLDGVDVKLYLDPSGRVRHIETATSVKERRLQAIVTKDVFYDEAKDEYSFTVMNEKGTKVNLTVTDADDFKDADGNKLTHSQILSEIQVSKNKPTVVTYELDSTGDVKEVKLVDTDNLIHVDKDKWDDVADEDDNLVKVGGEQYEVTDSTVVFNLTGNIEKTGNRDELKDAGTSKFSRIADEDYEVFFSVDSDNEVDYIYVIDGKKSLASDGSYGLVYNFETKGGDDYITILDQEGKQQTYKLDGSNKFQEYDFIYYELNSDNELVVDDSYKIVDGNDEDADYQEPTVKILKDNIENANLHLLTVARADEINGSKVTYEDAKGDKHTYVLNKSVVYYDIVNKEIKSGIDEGDYVVLIDTDDDGSAVDYVLFVASEDTVDDYDYDMTDFLKQGEGAVTPPPAGDDDLINDDSVVGKAVEFLGGTSVYKVEGDLNSDFKDAEVTVTIGDETFDAAVDADGHFTVTKTLEKGITSFEVTATKGDQSETFEGTF